MGNLHASPVTLVLAFSLFVVLLSCSNGQTPTPTQEIAGGSVPILTVTTPEDYLPGTSWVLRSWGPASNQKTVPSNARLAIEFSNIGRQMSGLIGCNAFDGSYLRESLAFTTTHLE